MPIIRVYGVYYPIIYLDKVIDVLAMPRFQGCNDIEKDVLGLLAGAGIRESRIKEVQQER